jgi:hypothetical protein
MTAPTDEANSGDFCLLLSKRGPGPRPHVLISSEDFERVSAHSWCAHTGGYAITQIKNAEGKWATTYLHRFLMNAGPGQIVDHRDQNPANNTRRNLRFCTVRENNMNVSKKPNTTSKYLGVRRVKNGQWRVEFRIHGKKTHFGCYPTEDEAGRVAAQKRKEHHGEFASWVEVQ